jgi:hypothetical protein
MGPDLSTMTVRSWGYATSDFLLAAVGLFVALFPGLSVVVALLTGNPLGTGPAAPVTGVVAVGGSYPFVAGDWSYGRLYRFLAGFLVAGAAATLAGLAVLAGRPGPLPDPVLARAVVLAVAYPAGVVGAFRDRIAVGWPAGDR